MDSRWHVLEAANLLISEYYLKPAFLGHRSERFFAVPSDSGSPQIPKESEGTAVPPIRVFFSSAPAGQREKKLKESEGKARFYSLCPAGAEEKNTRIGRKRTKKTFEVRGVCVEQTGERTAKPNVQIRGGPETYRRRGRRIRTFAKKKIDMLRRPSFFFPTHSWVEEKNAGRVSSDFWKRKIEDRSENRMRFSERSRICLIARRAKEQIQDFSFRRLPSKSLAIFDGRRGSFFPRFPPISKKSEETTREKGPRNRRKYSSAVENRKRFSMADAGSPENS